MNGVLRAAYGEYGVKAGYGAYGMLVATAAKAAATARLRDKNIVDG